MPTRDSVYRALVTNHRILESQKFAVDKLAAQIKEMKIERVTGPGDGTGDHYLGDTTTVTPSSIVFNNPFPLSLNC